MSHTVPEGNEDLLTRDALVAKMKQVHEQLGYLNCRLAVQMTIDFSKIEDLDQTSTNEMEVGDILAWKQKHFAIWIGYGQVLQVGGWGEPVTIEDYRATKEYWDEPSAVYRHPLRCPQLVREEEPAPISGSPKSGLAL